MSRVANNPINIPAGVEVNINNTRLTAKGGKSTLTQEIHTAVQVVKNGNLLKVAPKDNATDAEVLAGSVRALLANMMVGLSTGFERKLMLVGVGYRVQLQGRKLLLTLGFSHPVNYTLPDGVVAELPSQTEIVVKGADKQLVGQVAAEIRRFRPPEPYKGKGVRYSDEVIARKEGKKK